jgi:homoaconitase
LLHYAREVAGIEDLEKDTAVQGGVGPGGWYMAIELLGRMDSIEGSEDAVGELLHDIIGTFQESSSKTVDKILRMLNDLGMQNFAEETAEV